MEAGWGSHLNNTGVCIWTALTSRWGLVWWAHLHVTRAVGSLQNCLGGKQLSGSLRACVYTTVHSAAAPLSIQGQPNVMHQQ